MENEKVVSEIRSWHGRHFRVDNLLERGQKARMVSVVLVVSVHRNPDGFPLFFKLIDGAFTEIFNRGVHQNVIAARRKNSAPSPRSRTR